MFVTRRYTQTEGYCITKDTIIPYDNDKKNADYDIQQELSMDKKMAEVIQDYFVVEACLEKTMESASIDPMK
jgi:hypothetical protein